MKFKFLFSIFLIIFIVFVIYKFNVDKKNISLFIGDFNSKGFYNLYSNNYSYNEMRTTDLINDIKDNKKIGNRFLQNYLVKSNLISINVGINDVLSILESSNLSEYYDYFDSYLKDVEDLFKLIRIYDKEKIVFIGIYNPFIDSYNDYFSYLNGKLYNLCLDYDIEYIDILNVFDDSYLDGIKFNDKANKYIYSKLINY